MLPAPAKRSAVVIDDADWGLDGRGVATARPVWAVGIKPGTIQHARTCGVCRVGACSSAAQRGFHRAGADSGPPGPVQVGQDGAADVAGQVGRFGEDSAGSGDESLGGLHGDLVAGRVGARGGVHGVADGDAQRLVESEQCPHLLLESYRVARAQDPPAEQGMPQGEVGDLVFPPLVIEGDQRLGGPGAVIGQRGGQPVTVAVDAAVVAGDGHGVAVMIRTFTPPISDSTDPSGSCASTGGRRVEVSRTQELGLGGGDLAPGCAPCRAP